MLTLADCQDEQCLFWLAAKMSGQTAKISVVVPRHCAVKLSLRTHKNFPIGKVFYYQQLIGHVAGKKMCNPVKIGKDHQGDNYLALVS